MRRLVSNSTGSCLTTDDQTNYNAVWLSPCGGGRSGQFWTADNGLIQNQNRNLLAAEGNGDLFTAYYELVLSHFKWQGSHN